MDGPILAFLGPSLPLEEARSILDARYLPPAQAGDVLVALRLRPRAIGLVDGVFDRVASVWHKELLYAMEQGIPVAGASSMGALRAAELDRFGMLGVGEIYRKYRSGEYRDDDEVALLHADESLGYRGLSEPLVNIRATLRRAVREGLIAEDRARALVESARRLPYAERRWDRLSTGRGLEGLRRFLAAGGRVDQKAEDARALLRRLRSGLRRPPPLRVPLQRTLFLRYLLHESAATPFRVDRDWLPPGERAARAAAELPQFPFVRLLVRLRNLAPGPLRSTPRERAEAEALFRNVHVPEWTGTVPSRLRSELVRVWAALDRRLREEGLQPGPEEFQRWVDQVRRERGLTGRRATFAWLRKRGLSQARWGGFLASYFRLRFVLKNPPLSAVAPRVNLPRVLDRLSGR